MLINLRRLLLAILILSGLNAYSWQLITSENGGLYNTIELNSHPRLFFSKGEENTILKKAKSNKLLTDIIAVLKTEADRELLAPPQLFTPNTQFLKTSRTQIARIMTLAMAYRLFKDDKYAKKVESELLNVCQFASWNPSHFLDVAEMTTAVAIGYDWCYYKLLPNSRKIIEGAIIEKAFKPAWPIYEETGETPFNRENNWNMVCNSGMLSGAIAIGDKYPDELKTILNYAVKYTPNLLKSFAPDGVFNEGPGYWSYNGMYMSLFFDNLNRNIGNDFGLPEFEGISNTANFYMSIIGPSNQTFNFGDASTRIDINGTFFYLSRQYKNPEIALFYRKLLSNAVEKYHISAGFTLPRFFFLCIPWFDESIPKKSTDESKLQTFKGVTDFIIINGSERTNKNRIYLAAKTGRGDWSHNQLDAGSFILDSDGERWGIDIGSETYSLPKFWDYKSGGVRWNYFRNTNKAHNTLTLDDKITSSDGEGKLIKADKKSSQPFGIFDISAPYKDQAISVLRGFKLLSDDVILIRDEITPKQKSKNISWKFYTNAEVKIDGNLAILSQKGKEFYIQCISKTAFKMIVQEAKNHIAEEKPLNNIRYIEIIVSASEKQLSIPVLMGKSPQSFKKFSSENDKEFNKW